MSIDRQQVDRSGSYVSLLSHYDLEGFPVELVGDLKYYVTERYTA